MGPTGAASWAPATCASPNNAAMENAIDFMAEPMLFGGCFDHQCQVDVTTADAEVGRLGVDGSGGGQLQSPNLADADRGGQNDADGKLLGIGLEDRGVCLDAARQARERQRRIGGQSGGTLERSLDLEAHSRLRI